MSAVATAGGLPTRLGKYEILTALASGGMATIYIGRSTGIGSFERHVVLKVILPERANDETSVQMFLDEARLAASLNHQNVAQVFEVGQDTGIHYLAMEYVHGQDLRALLAKAGSTGTRVPIELALTVVAGAAAGLDHAHERRSSDGTPMGIVHRDVSPSNIMIGYDGSVKLLDFGIAKATMRSVETQSGIIKGKFAYMAPEQCRGREVDRRSDVFSLGIILYEVTTQHRCFRADSDFDTMHRIVTGDIVRPSRLVQGYPQALEAIVMKALAVDANQRYASAGQLLEAIEGFATSGRMSLSTMSLGRFMRDMFGEVQEPWLASGRISQPVVAREQTISNTNGSGSRPGARTGSGSGARHDELADPDEPPLHLPPTQLFDA
ncbi:MAG: serine/threonine-protein kinase, partial [Kofleriaceae bacterium]